MSNIVKKNRWGNFRVNKERNFWFKIVRIVITTVVFSIIFVFLVLKITNPFFQWLGTISAVAFAMMMGTPTARVVTKSSFRDDKDFQFFTRAFFVIFIYSTLVWMSAQFDIYSKLNFGYIMIIFAFAKSFVFLLSDYFADKLAFGG